MPVLLDLFSCEGVGARGYIAAGFDVIGNDLEPRFAKRYPAERFEPGDWRVVLDKYAGKVDAVHASPPCQGYTVATASRPDVRQRYPRLIGDVREALEHLGVPYVIENVPGASQYMINPVTLCGSMFGLSAVDDDGTPLVMRRHRLFETNFEVTPPVPCVHRRDEQVAGSYGGARKDKVEARHVRKGGYVPAKHVQEDLLGVAHGAHTLHGLYQSIPPAYTHYLGTRILELL